MPFYESMLNFQYNRERFIKRYPNHIVNNIHKSLFQPITKDNVGVWEKKLSRKEVMIADFVVGKTGANYGYEKKFTIINFAAWIASLPGIHLYYILNPIKNMALHLPFWWQLRVLRNFHRINGSFLYKFKKSD